MSRCSCKQKISIVLAAVALSGCASFNQFFQSGDQLPAGAFRSTAAIRAQTVPLPVDIAENILSISENGEVTTGETEPGETQLLSEAKDKVPSTKMKKISAGKVADSEKHKHSFHPFSGRKRLAASVSSGRHGRTLKYSVKSGDTLMKIAFAKYGDIFRWRDIYEQNRQTIKNFNLIQVGMMLVLNGVEFIVIERNGEPYLIRRGDTLRGISQKVYGSDNHWKNIWQNNRRLITHPNRIYAGFTLYYRTLAASKAGPESRQPSSRKK